MHRGGCGTVDRIVGDAGEHVAKVGGVLPSSGGILRETLAHDAIESGRRDRLQAARGRRHRRQNRRRHAGTARPLERFSPRRHLEKDRPEREQIRSCVGTFALDLFRRHVLQGADDCPHLRERERSGGDARHRHSWLILVPPRETEVEDLRPGRAKHHVRRFQIAMGQPLAMGGVERIGELRADAQHLFERQRAAQQAMCKCLAGHVLHHQKIDTVLFPDVVKRADVGMRQTRDRARLPPKPCLALRIGSQVRWEDLDCHRAIEPQIACAVDLAHPTGSERCDDFVWTKPHAIQ
jgi:hypothetical protein